MFLRIQRLSWQHVGTTETTMTVLHPTRFFHSHHPTRRRQLVFRNGRWEYANANSLDQNYIARLPQAQTFATEPASQPIQAPITDKFEIKEIEAGPSGKKYIQVKQLADEPTIIAGIKLPTRPTPPASDDCCMSGRFVIMANRRLDSSSL